MHEVQYSRRAKSDLLDFWLHVAADNLSAADRLLEEIELEVTRLARQPYLGRTRPELASGLRSWPQPYPIVIFYVARPHGITVVRLLHHARDARGQAFEAREAVGAYRLAAGDRCQTPVSDTAAGQPLRPLAR